jgi:hypothetical protein
MPGAIVMSGALLGERFAAEADVRNGHTHTAIRQGAGRAGGRVLLIRRRCARLVSGCFRAPGGAVLARRRRRGRGRQRQRT